MALSNIFREPRREITETMVGLAVAATVLGLIAWPDYYFALWWQDFTVCSAYGGCLWSVGIKFGILFAGFALLGMFVVHELGDAVCDALQTRRIHLRPRQRY